MGNTTHRLCRHRYVAHVELDEHREVVAVIIPLDTGDKVRIDDPADIARLRRALLAGEDQLRQARKVSA